MIRKRIYLPGDSLPTNATHLVSAGAQSMTLSVVNGVLNVSATMANLANAYIYKDLTSITDYVIQTGDFIEYDIIWDGSGLYIAVDLTTSDTYTLRDCSGRDQNNLSPHADTNLTTYANGKWYRRRIPITTLYKGGIANAVGKTITNFDIVCENNVTGTYVARIANLAITDGKGAQQIPFATSKYY